jgi:hypothetical protein
MARNGTGSAVVGAEWYWQGCRRHRTALAVAIDSVE